MHQAVTEVVQVEPFAGHVGAQQEADGVILAAEAVHQVLLVGVGHLAVEHRHLVGLEPQVPGELALQPAQGFEALGEDHQSIPDGVGPPAEVSGAQVGEQTLVFAETGGRRVAGQGGQGRGEPGQDRNFLLFLRRARGLVPEQVNALGGGFEGGGGAGEQGLLQPHPLKLLLTAPLVLAGLGEGNVQQGAVGGLFLGAGGPAQAEGLALLEVALDLVLDVLLEAPDDQALAAEVVGGVVVGVGDGGGVQQAHQGGEAARRAVVGRGRQQDEGVRAVGQQAREAGAPRQPGFPRPGRDVVAFVDDDQVPPGVLKIIPVLQIVLEGVDGNDAAVVVIERVVVGRDAVAHPRQTHRVQTHQGDGEAGPPLLLELGEHGLLGDDQDAFAAPALDQFGGQDAALQGLAQAGAVGDEDARPRLAQGLQGGVKLIGDQVHHAPVAQVDGLVIGHAAPALALQIEQGGVVGGAGVGDQFRLGGVEDLDGRFQGGEEERGLTPYQVGNPVAGQQPAPIDRGVGTADEPFLVPNDGPGAGGKGQHKNPFLL